MYHVGAITSPWEVAWPGTSDPGWLRALGAAWRRWASPSPRRQPPRLENTGGPMSRTRKERIQSEMLGNATLEIGWPQEHFVYLDHTGHKNVFERIDHCLGQLGFAGPEEASAGLGGMPGVSMHCRRLKSSVNPARSDNGNANSQSPEESLRVALILGRCSEILYDPDKPVIWTRGRLVRPVRLYHAENFYDDD